jgi:four helix bundle protein
VCRTISYQLLKAGTSIGANLEEAQAGQSKADFISKNSISLKEARESHYWLRLIIATNLMPETEVEELRDEAEQLMKIIGSIVTSAKRNLELD